MENQGFWAYYRGYTNTGIHAAATAALTAFGLLTFVHRWFALVAIAAYVLPPIYLYATRARRTENAGRARSTAEHRGPAAADAQNAAERATADAAGDAALDGADSDPTERRWTVVRTPTGATLHDVVCTGDGIYAVGDGGVVLSRAGGEWETLLDAGPNAESNALTAVDATDDGAAVWVAGAGGALGRIDASSGRHTDRSAPNGITNGWTGVAVAGPAGGETVVLADGSGRLLRGEYRDGTVAWGEPTKPGSGSSIAGVSLISPALGYACDTNATVFETRDGGGRYETVGIDGAGSLADVSATDSDRVVVAGVDGRIHRRDGSMWTAVETDGGHRAIDLWEGAGLACGDGGAIHELDDSGGWERVAVPISSALFGVCVGRGEPDAAVGADGTVLERR